MPMVQLYGVSTRLHSRPQTAAAALDNTVLVWTCTVSIFVASTTLRYYQSWSTYMDCISTLLYNDPSTHLQLTVDYACNVELSVQ